MDDDVTPLNILIGKFIDSKIVSCRGVWQLGGPVTVGHSKVKG